MRPANDVPLRAAIRATALSIVGFLQLLVGRRLHQPTDNVGRVLVFGDGTHTRVYRETIVAKTTGDQAPLQRPTVLVVAFRLRFVRGSWMHRVFRWESQLNYPLFVGYPGIVSKLWCAHDGNDVYRGVYQWDGPDRADAYARSLSWILRAVSVRGSVRHRVYPNAIRDEWLASALPAGADGLVGRWSER